MSENENNIPVKEKFYFSYSSLVKLLTSPKLFYKEYILKEKDDKKAKYLDMGSLIHCLLFEPENFDNKFVIMNQKVPDGKIREVIDYVFKNHALSYIKDNPDKLCFLDNFKHEILQQMLAIDLYQSLTDDKKPDKEGIQLTADDKRLGKAFDPKLVEYFNTLVESEKKIVVDYSMVQKAKEQADVIRNYEPAMNLFKEEDDEFVESRNELELKCDLTNYPFGLKGIIDNIKVYHKEKKIIINDLKSTSKTLKEWYEAFPTSIYMYYLQPVVYKELLLSLIPKDKQQGWVLEVNFIVIDKENMVYVFPVSVESLYKWEHELKLALDKASWHMNENKYDLPYELYTKVVKL